MVFTEAIVNGIADNFIDKIERGCEQSLHIKW